MMMTRDPNLKERYNVVCRILFGHKWSLDLEVMLKEEEKRCGINIVILNLDFFYSMMLKERMFLLF